MSKQKQAYLNHIRTDTAYPTYRGIIGVVATLGYLLAALQLVGGVLGGMAAMSMNSQGAGLGAIVMSIVIATLLFVGIRFWREAATVLVDIGDSVVDENSRKAQVGAVDTVGRRAG